MELDVLRSRIRAVIFAILGIMEAFLFLRITLDLISADSSNGIVSLVSQITSVFIFPFEGLITLPQSGILMFINEAAIIAFIVYILVAIALSEFITSFLFDNFKDVFQNFVDAIFKFLESFLILRILFDLFAVGLNLESPLFVRVIYGSTEWAQGVIFEQPFLSGRINLSTLLWLIIIIVIDLLTERFVDGVFIQLNDFSKKFNIHLPKRPKIKLLSKFNIKSYFKKILEFGTKKVEISDSPNPSLDISKIPAPTGIASPLNVTTIESILRNETLEQTTIDSIKEEILNPKPVNKSTIQEG